MEIHAEWEIAESTVNLIDGVEMENAIQEPVDKALDNIRVGCLMLGITEATPRIEISISNLGSCTCLKLHHIHLLVNTLIDVLVSQSHLQVAIEVRPRKSSSINELSLESCVVKSREPQQAPISHGQ